MDVDVPNKNNLKYSFILNLTNKIFYSSSRYLYSIYFLFIFFDNNTIINDIILFNIKINDIISDSLFNGRLNI